MKASDASSKAKRIEEQLEELEKEVHLIEEARNKLQTGEK